MKYDVFISYSRKDTKIVDEFVGRLESEGFRVWIDRDGVESGDAFKRVIVNAIKESALFMFFSSESSNSSPWTTKEVSIAVHYEKPIVPIKLDKTIYNEDLEFDLVNLDYIDYSDLAMHQPLMEKLVRTLKSKLPRREEQEVTNVETKTQPIANESQIVNDSVTPAHTSSKETGKKGKKGFWIVLGILAVGALAAFLLSVLGSREEQLEATTMTFDDLTITANGISFTMKPIEGESFVMGGTEDNPAHEETINSFYMGETEVTQALWMAVMGGPPSHNGGWTVESGLGDNYPAYEISWKEIQDFLRKLNGLTNRNFRLPTDAEWEFAARGGKKANGYMFAGSPRVEEVAWYNKNSGNLTHEVKQLKPNELGLYDMSGNVWEWCNDLYEDDAKEEMYVLRGGGWNRNADRCQVTFRGQGGPYFRGNSHGFRLAMSVE